jgi:5'-nucleotidase
MKILISNDDGYQAPGIVALSEALARIADVDVIAPEHNNSAKSNALTLHSPLYVHTAANGFRYVNGTPADSVHIALTGLLGYRPDLVVSGINNGANMGDDTIYSGTVAAATEGYLLGVPAIAVSLASFAGRHFETAGRVARELVQRFTSTPFADPVLLNVNVPDVPYTDLRGIQVTRLGRRHKAEPAVKSVSPRGETLYWIGPAGPAADAGEGTDFHAVEHGWVSVTPLQIDLTHAAQLGQVRTWLGNGP